MNELNKRVTTIGNSLENEIVEFLRTIIAIPSKSGRENEVIKRIQKEMKKIGYDEVWIDPFGNLIGRIGSGKRIIAFDGHCDTVDTGNLNTWKIDPFKGACKNEVIYGRGASDQKGGLASAIYAGKIIKKIGIPDNITMYVVASVLEEDFEGLCWQYIIEEDKLKPEVVILTEPTNLEIKIGQRGRMAIIIRAPGLSCHGSTPLKGDNAIYKITPVIQDIEKLNHCLSSNSILGKGSIAVTDITSTAPSLCAVPDSATINLDRRLTEGENSESCLKEILDLKSVQSSEAEVFVPEGDILSYTGLSYHQKAYYPPWLIKNNHPLVKEAGRVYQALFGEKAKIGVWDFSTNGVVTKGVYDIPSIGFGPGKEEHAHTPNDQIKIDDLKKAMEFYALFTLFQG